MEQNNEKLEQAKKELEAVCQKFGITLVPVVVHQGDKTISSIEIVPRVNYQPEAQTEQPAAEQL